MKRIAHLLLLLISLLLLCACTEEQPIESDTQLYMSSQTASETVTDTDSDVSVESSEETLTPPPCAHTFGAWETVTEAAEGQAGLKKRICTLCEEEETEEIPAITPHVHAYTETVFLADCTEEGYTEKYCDCGHILRENVTEPLGHKYTDWVVILRPTYSMGGMEERKCSVCGLVDNRSTPPLPIPETPHIHEYVEIITAPTCTTKGFVENYCPCGESQILEIIPTGGHVYGEWYESLAPGQYGGLSRRDCEFCGDVEMKTIPALSQNPESPDTPENPDDVTDSDGSHTSTGASGSGSGGGDLTEDTDTPQEPSSGTIVYYNQRDEQWGNLAIGCGNMKSNGCGPTSIAMVLSYFGIHVTPPEVAQWLYNNTIEFNHDFHGISGSGIRLGLEHWNRTVYPIRTYEEYINHLRNGAIVIGAQGQGTFVTKKENSHCIVIANLTAKGKVTCYDPYTSRLNGTYYAESVWEERSTIPVDLRREGVTHYAVY